LCPDYNGRRYRLLWGFMPQDKLGRYAHILRHCAWVARDRPAAVDVLRAAGLTGAEANDVIVHGLKHDILAEWGGGFLPTENWLRRVSSVAKR
jgi:hypothetical protein